MNYTKIYQSLIKNAKGLVEKAKASLKNWKC
jgi:hypothetical protein